MKMKLFISQLTILVGVVLFPQALFAEDFAESVQVGNTTLTLILDGPADMSVSAAELNKWIAVSAKTVENLYGAFPVNEALIALQVQKGKGVHRGMAMGVGGASINIWLGAESGVKDFRQDWIMVHEMVHLAFPRVANKHDWIEEGIATYMEPIARAAMGNLSAEKVWAFFLNGMPKGLPEYGDKGLDNTPTWGRTYWGGAMFCLLADIAIRQQSEGKKSLRDALIGIVDAGYSFLDTANLVKVLTVADKATNTTVLMDLYRQHRNTAVQVDLPSLWHKLGVSLDSAGKVKFDNAAPWARMREDITFAR